MCAYYVYARLHIVYSQILRIRTVAQFVDKEQRDEKAPADRTSVCRLLKTQLQIVVFVFSQDYCYFYPIFLL